jgi:hypothetical protein
VVERAGLLPVVQGGLQFRPVQPLLPLLPLLPLSPLPPP